MTMTEGERKAYQRGYNTGRSSAGWPDHLPPLPPNVIAREVLESALALRDIVDGFLASLDGDDQTWDVAVSMGDALDRMNHALSALTLFAKDGR